MLTYAPSCLLIFHALVSFVVVVVSDSLSHTQLFETLGTAAHQAPLSMGFPSKEY